VLPVTPLTYLPTPPGGEVPPQSTLHVEVEIDSVIDPWEEVISLVHSDDGAEEGDHFIVETDEHRRSTLRFGNGVNGRRLPERAIVRCEYQVGEGISGNVGATSLRHVQPLASAPLAITAVWNPFDVTDGREPEPVEKVLRNAPEAYRTRQLRAVTLADYQRRAQEVPGVARAVAEYAWTGSWRTVRIVLDPAGSTVLDAELLRQTAEHLQAVRLIGEDLELRPPRFIPLSIEVELCLHPDFWPADVRFAVEQELSDGWTPDGRRGFFHPDEWTFGQALHRSALAGRIHAVTGVEHITSITIRRFDAVTPGAAAGEVLDVRFDEIVLVRNDPDQRELGTIDLALDGGRQ
jgi:predicted phage baseplate assembly protein